MEKSRESHTSHVTFGNCIKSALSGTDRAEIMQHQRWLQISYWVHGQKGQFISNACLRLHLLRITTECGIHHET